MLCYLFTHKIYLPKLGLQKPMVNKFRPINLGHETRRIYIVEALMSANQATQTQLKNISQEELLIVEVAEIEKLEKLIDDSLVEIQSLQLELEDLEQDLSHFLDRYYGSGAIFFKNNDSNPRADNDNADVCVTDLDQAKKDIYSKIAKVCSRDNFGFSEQHAHDGLLKIEGYLTDGTDQCLSPQDLLSNLSVEYHKLIKQANQLKTKKQNLLDSPAYELRQEIMWANIKTAETISKIKANITHQVNRPN